MKPSIIDEEEWNELVASRASFQLFDAFNDLPIDGVVERNPLDYLHEYEDIDEGKITRLAPDEAGFYWDGNKPVAYWDVAS